MQLGLAGELLFLLAGEHLLPLRNAALSLQAERENLRATQPMPTCLQTSFIENMKKTSSFFRETA